MRKTDRLRVLRASVVNFLPLFLASSGMAAGTELAPIPVDAFVRLGAVDRAQTGFRLSPSGMFASYVDRTPDSARLMIRAVGTGEGEPRDLSAVLGAGIRDCAWYEENGKDRLACFCADGETGTRVHAVDPAGPAFTEVVRSKEPLQFSGNDPADPGRLMVRLGARGDLARLDMAKGTIGTLFENVPGYTRLILDPSGELRLAATADGCLLHRPEVRSPFREVPLARPGDSLIPVFGFTPDCRRIHAFSDRGRDRIALVTLDLHTGEETLVYEHPYLDFIRDNVVHSRKKGTVVGVTFSTEPGGVFFDEDWKKIHAFVSGALPDEAVEYIDASRDETRHLVGTVSAKNGVSVHLVDMAKRTTKLLARRGAWPDGSPCPERKTVFVEAADGMRLHATLFLPPGRKAGGRLPAVVMAHEIPWRETPLAVMAAGNFHFLASRGYAVLYVDHRGCAGLGRAYRKAAAGELVGKVMSDYRDAARWLVKEGIADPKRIGLYGQDWGGFVAAWSAAMYPDLFACAISVKGGLDLKGMIPAFPAFYGELRPHEKREADAFLAGKENLSLSGLDVRKVKAPLLFMTIDAMNLFADKEATRRFVSDVTAAGGRSWHVDIEESLYTYENLVRYHTVLEAFFARHLGGRTAGQDPDVVLEGAAYVPPMRGSAEPNEAERQVLEYHRMFPDMAECFDVMFGRFVPARPAGARPDGITDKEWERLFQLRTLPEASFTRIHEEAVRRLKVESSGYLGVFPGAAKDGAPAAVLDGVVEGGPAEKGGLKTGDRVTGVNEKAVASPDDLLKVLSGLKAGDVANLTLLRKAEGGDDERLTIAVVLEKRPAPAGGDPLGAALRRVPLVPARPLALTGKSPSDEALRRAVTKGVACLLALRGTDGLWAYQAKSQVDPAELTQEFSLINVGAVQVECTPWLMTSLAGMALRASTVVDPSRRAEMEPLVAKALDFVSQAPQGETPGGVYRHLVLDFLCAEYRLARDEALRTRIRDRAAELSRALLRHRFPGKGWGYDLGSAKPSASFITAPVLLSLDRARAAGIAIPAEVLREASDALWKTRAKGAMKGERGWYPGEEGREWYIYVEGNEADNSSRLRGGAGRIPMCDLALYRLGHRSQADLARGLATFLEVRDELDTHWGYRGIHAGPYANASYYILYDYWYAAMAANALEDAALRARVHAVIQETLLAHQAPDGTWCDHPAFGKLYGTAMALMALGETVR